MTQNRYAQAFDFWNKAMDGQKTRKTAVTRKAPLKVQTELSDEVRVLDSELGEIDELAIDENFTAGGDPYNTTGKHVIIKLEKGADE
jgi:hypothetical protein